MRVAAAINLDEATRAELQRLLRRRTTAVRVAERCRGVLLAGDWHQGKQIAERMSVAPRTAARWPSKI
jgi:hypothetical protein